MTVPVFRSGLYDAVAVVSDGLSIVTVLSPLLFTALPADVSHTTTTLVSATVLTRNGSVVMDSASADLIDVLAGSTIVVTVFLMDVYGNL